MQTIRNQGLVPKSLLKKQNPKFQFFLNVILLYIFLWNILALWQNVMSSGIPLVSQEILVNQLRAIFSDVHIFLQYYNTISFYSILQYSY